MITCNDSVGHLCVQVFVCQQIIAAYKSLLGIWLPETLKATETTVHSVWIFQLCTNYLSVIYCYYTHSYLATTTRQPTTFCYYYWSGYYWNTACSGDFSKKCVQCANFTCCFKYKVTACVDVWVLKLWFYSNIHAPELSKPSHSAACTFAKESAPEQSVPPELEAMKHKGRCVNYHHSILGNLACEWCKSL